jgi:nucleoside-diphosphate-sugar epimerase
MNILILGYGYCGFYLAKELLTDNTDITTVSRTAKDSLHIDGVKHLTGNLESNLSLNQSYDLIFYLAPPLREGIKDMRLRTCLKSNNFKTTKWIYFGSTGVYGNHQGDWVSESSECHIQFDRQARRLDAESALADYSKTKKSNLLVLRLAGIYGPNRLPLDAVKLKTPIINPTEAPWSNLIYVKDLAKISSQLAQTVSQNECFNIADGLPCKMGTLQEKLSKLINKDIPSYLPLNEVLKTASPMKKEFLLSSKRISIDKLKTQIQALKLTDLDQAIKKSLQES